MESNKSCSSYVANSKYTSLSDRTYNITKTMKIISNPISLNILFNIREGKKNIRDLSNIDDTSQRNIYIHLKSMIDEGIITKKYQDTKEYELTYFGKLLLDFILNIEDLIPFKETNNSIFQIKKNGIPININPNNIDHVMAELYSYGEIGRIKLLKNWDELLRCFSNLSKITNKSIDAATRYFNHDFINNIVNVSSQDIDMRVLISSKIEILDFISVMIGSGVSAIEDITSSNNLEFRLSNVSFSGFFFDDTYAIIEIPKPEGIDNFGFLSLKSQDLNAALRKDFDNYWSKALKLDISKVFEIMPFDCKK